MEYINLFFIIGKVKIKKLPAIFLIILATLSGLIYLLVRYKGGEQTIGNVIGTDKEKMSLSSINTNPGFDPRTVAGALKYVALGTILEKEYEPVQEKLYTSRNGMFSFNYPSYMFVGEYPQEMSPSNSSRFLLSSRRQDLNYIAEAQKCVQSNPPAPVYCNDGEGDFYVFSVDTDRLNGFFHDEIDEVSQGQKQPVPSELENVFLINESAFIQEKIPQGVAETSVTQDWHNLKYSFRIKYGDANKPSVYLTMNGTSSPSTWPFDESIASIVTSLKINK